MGTILLTVYLLIFGRHSGVWVVIFLSRFRSSRPVFLSCFPPFFSLRLRLSLLFFLRHYRNGSSTLAGVHWRIVVLIPFSIGIHQTAAAAAAAAARTVYRIWEPWVGLGWGVNVCVLFSGHLGTVIN